MTGADHRERRIVRLQGGTLELVVGRADLELDALCGFAARINAKRGFLFVSKVLGKHYPVRPETMDRVHAMLAAKLEPALPGPVVFIALAETAIGLGQSVYEQYRTRTGRSDTLFLHSTRYRVGDGACLQFAEAHSHAPRQFIHAPRGGAEEQTFRSARSLVLVDDEITTGNTFVELAASYGRFNDALEHVSLACITDWSSVARRHDVRERLRTQVSSVSLLEGTYRFETAVDAAVPAGAPSEPAISTAKDGIARTDCGRLGVGRPPVLPEEILSRALCAVAPGQSVLVLGSGEFLYLPFQLALALERAGHAVTFQSTTRSPIQVGHDIKQCLSFADNYFENIPNYLYNVAPGEYDRVLACYETGALPPDHDLPAQLGAEVLMFP